MTRKPEIVGVRIAARSRLFRIEAVCLRFSDGTEREFERIAGGPRAGTAMVVAMPDPATVLLIREYAVGLDRFELSLPTGLIEPTESSIEAANRELMEETGYAASLLERIHTLTLAPGIFGYQAEIILASGLRHCPLCGDEPEPLEVIRWPIARLDDIGASLEITEARTLAALFIARSLLRRRAQAQCGGRPEPAMEIHHVPGTPCV